MYEFFKSWGKDGVPAAGLVMEFDGGSCSLSVFGHSLGAQPGRGWTEGDR